MASRPASGPANVADFRLAVDGQPFESPLARALAEGDRAGMLARFADITDKVRPRLVSLTLTEKRGDEADSLELVLDDADGGLSIPRRGTTLRLQLGWLRGPDVTPGLVDKGRFTVDEAEWSGPPDTVTLRARSADVTRNFRARRERGFTGTTLGAVAREIAAANGYAARVAPELANIPVPALAQHQKSDMALLRELGHRHDAIATVKDRTVILSPIGKGATPSGRPIDGVRLVRAAGDGYRYRLVDRGAEDGVEARWHDRDANERKTVKVGGGGGRPKRIRRTFHTEGEAKSAAQAEHGRMKRASAEFELNLALGDATLFPDRPAAIAGFKPEPDAIAWLIAEVRHSLNGDGGFSSQLKLERSE